MPSPQRLFCKWLRHLNPPPCSFSFCFSLMEWAHSLRTYILYSCRSPMASPYISTLKPFTRFCQMDLLNVSIDLHYCPHRGHDSSVTLFLSENIHAHVGNIIYMWPFSLKQLFESVLSLFVIHPCQWRSR